MSGRRRSPPPGIVRGVAAIYDVDNVDTDRIIPGRFLMKSRHFDYADLLFRDIRAGALRDAAFPLNDPRFSDAKIMLTGRNFGCGSAREQAAFALADFGIQALVGRQFADIFRRNCIRNGIFVATISDADMDAIKAGSGSGPELIEIDVGQKTMTTSRGERIRLEVPDQDIRDLFATEDDIAATLRHADAIAEFERSLSRGER